MEKALNDSGSSLCCCFNICCPRKQQQNKWADVKYNLVPSTSEGTNNIPTPDIVKEFSFVQAKTEYAVPLRPNPQNGITQPITAQPKRQRSLSEPALPPGFNPSVDVVESPKRTLPSLESTQRLPIHTFSPTLITTSHYKQMSMPDFGGYVEEPADERPEIEFSVYYTVRCWTLMVYLHCARNLPVGSLNPTVALYLLPNREDIFQSQVNANPTFDRFEFRGLLPDEIRHQTLVFKVYSHLSKDEMLGGLSLSLSEADLFGATCRKKLETDIGKLKMVTRGDLLISLKYNQVAKTLKGVVEKATNLQKQGILDLYVKIRLLKNGQPYQKWKSMVKPNTLITIFHERFKFDLSEMHPKEVTLKILMKDDDGDVVGVVYIGSQVPHDTGRQHWKQIFSQPNTAVSSWHCILPITAETERPTRKKKCELDKQTDQNKQLQRDVTRKGSSRGSRRKYGIGSLQVGEKRFRIKQ